jgi:hypothetical protein
VPVILALHEDWITLADPEWLRVVARGCKWILGGFKWGLIVFGAFGFLTMIDATSLSSDWLVIPAGCAFCCIAWGLWLFASPHPRLAVGDPIEAPRRFVRWGIILTLLTLVVSIAAMISRQPGTAIAIALVGAPFGLGGVVALWMLGTYTAMVAQRAGTAYYARKVRRYRWGYLLSWLPFAGGSVSFMAVQSPAMIILALLGTVGVLGFGALLAAAPIYVLNLLEECAAIAAENWNQAERSSHPLANESPRAAGALENQEGPSD